MKTVAPSLQDPLSVLRGVGPARSSKLARLGLATIEDLLFRVPMRMHWSVPVRPVVEVVERLGEEVRVRGKLSRPSLMRRGGKRSVMRAKLTDATGSIGVLFFNQAYRRAELLELAESGEEVELTGPLGKTKSGPAFTAPAIGTTARPLPEPGTPVAFYPAGEGIGQELLRGLIRVALEGVLPALDDPLSEESLDELGIVSLDRAVQGLHAPASDEEHRVARRRFALEACLHLQARALEGRASSVGSARPVVLDAKDLGRILGGLPLAPTAAQRRVVGEIVGDMGSRRPMRRLLQGDVGSGKTLVALAVGLAVLERGGQVALLVPTEILAEQHYAVLGGVLAEAGFRAVRLSGSMSAPERRASVAALASGEAQFAIGTHALFSRDVSFRRLDLAIIDEQQRFGVAHRRSLLAKGRDVHALLMTATPIPRTLAKTLYADLDVSVLDEKPPGRGRVETRQLSPRKRAPLEVWLAERLRGDERAFWICPLIASEASEAEAGEDTQAVEATFARLSAGVLGPLGVEFVHGRQSAEERALRLSRFQRGEAKCLVATTLIEVGVDVPQATVLVVESAERFGLAQLHQLRGRVGRSSRNGWCFLFGNESARERLEILVRTSDGFEIAEEDLRQRGMGDLLGLRQAGKNAEGLTGDDVDLELVHAARALCLEDSALLRRYAR